MVASTRTEAVGLPLAAYAERVSLGDTFERRAGFNREDRAAAVGQLIPRLLREKVPDALRAAAERAREGHDARQLLRALLTVRPPGVLPESSRPCSTASWPASFRTAGSWTVAPCRR